MKFHESTGVLGADELQAMVNTKDGHNFVLLVPTCHPNAPFFIAYYSDPKVLGCYCAICKKQVCAIGVAHSSPHPVVNVRTGDVH